MISESSFLDKIKEKFNNKFDTSSVEFIDEKTPVRIICPHHGAFYKTPTALLRSKLGCPTCIREHLTRNSFDLFVDKANTVHYNKYEYIFNGYPTHKHKQDIYCPIHGKFTRWAKDHISGMGCHDCKKISGGLARLKQAGVAKHGEKYDYSKVQYVNRFTKVTIGCPIHGDFQQTPTNHTKHGCAKCGAASPITKHKFIAIANTIHANKYDYTKVEYRNTYTKVDIICPHHGVFSQMPMSHTNRGYGCPTCGRDSIKVTEADFYDRVNSLDTDYDYTDTQFVSLNDQIDIRCPKHGVFSQLPHVHLRGGGCPACNRSASSGERSIRQMVSSLGFNDITLNDRTIVAPQELDIYIPSKRIAIEYNGVYWHSELNGKGMNYHITKTKKCNTQDIQLIHVWDVEYINTPDIVKSRIRIKLGTVTHKIHARKCKITTVSSQQTREFLERTHIQGNANSSTRLGLIYGGELVMVMTFGKPRFSKYGYELIRMSSELNTIVVGGASKLFRHFLRLYDPESIVTYADNRWNTGGGYSHMGFTISHDSPPCSWYFHNNKPYKLLHRANFQKHKLEKKLDTFDPSLTAWDNLKINGYNRVWDCGNKVLTWTK